MNRKRRRQVRRLHGGSILTVKNVTYRIRRFKGYGPRHLTDWSTWLHGEKLYEEWGPHCRMSNLTLTAGVNIARRQLHDPAWALATTVAQYIAVTATVITPASGDTTLSGEHSGDGIGRAAGTYSSLGGTGQWQQQITMTYTNATPITLNGSAIFDASTSGNMYYESVMSPAATLNQNDQVQLTWQGTESPA